MTARVLVVDDVLPNVKLLEVKLSREYFDVITAMSGREALAKVEAENPDIVLLDVMMPGMDGFEVCRRLKSDPRFGHIPVVMVTALSDATDRVLGLEAGADDFLTKPVNDIALIARVRSLVRMKLSMDELRLREQTSQSFGVIDIEGQQASGGGARILAVEDREHYARILRDVLGGEHDVVVAASGEEAMAAARGGGFDLVVVSLALKGMDSLRLCAQFRTLEGTRHVPLLVLADDSPSETQRLVKGLELGVSDYLIRPLDRNELLARTRTQVRRRRYEERLRYNYHQSIALAVTDSLTGLYNRRYLTSHLEGLLGRTGRSRAFSLLMLDLDDFKRINDTYGHEAGDAVLAEFAQRLQRAVRGIDLAARYGGEEFVVLMPDTGLEAAAAVAERLRRAVADAPFTLPRGGQMLPVTVSIGVAEARRDDTPPMLLRRGDMALYAAKQAGRNRVVVETPPEANAADRSL